MICPNCKKENPQEAKYCIECGKKIRYEGIIDRNYKRKRIKRSFRGCVSFVNGLLLVTLIYLFVCIKASSTEVVTYEYNDHKEYAASTSDPLELFTLGHGFSRKTSNKALFESKEEYRRSVNYYVMICSGLLLVGGIIKMNIQT